MKDAKHHGLLAKFSLFTILGFLLLTASPSFAQDTHDTNDQQGCGTRHREVSEDFDDADDEKSSDSDSEGEESSGTEQNDESGPNENNENVDEEDSTTLSISGVVHQHIIPIGCAIAIAYLGLQADFFE